MQENSRYRSRVRRTTRRLIWAGVVYVIVLLPCILAQFAIRSRWNLTLAGCTIVLSVVYTLYNAVVSLRLQEFMNENVGRALR